MARRLITCIFICFCAVLLMSHNTSAFSMVLNYDNYESISYAVRSNVDCTINGNLVTNQGYCTTTNQTGNFSLTRLVTNSQFSVKAGDIVNFKVVVFSPNNFAFNYGTSYINNQVQSGRVIGFNEVLNDDVANFYHLDTDYTSPNYGNITGGNYISRVYEYFVRVSTGSDTYQVGLNSSSNSYPILTWYTNSVTDVLYFKIVDINVFRFKGSEENAEQADKTQEASDQSAQDGESSQNSAEGASQSLLSATGSIVSALTSAPATDCLIDISTRQFSVGQVNLCSNVPQGVLTFVHGLIGLVFTPIVLYFCYNVVTTLYNLFKEYNS